MVNKRFPEDMREVWQNQEVEGAKMSIEEIRDGLRRLEKIARKRKLVGLGICPFLMAVFVFFFFAFPTALERTGAALELVGLGYVIYRYLLSSSGLTEFAAPAHTDSRRFYRAALEREVAFYLGLGWLPLTTIPLGVVVFEIGIALSHPGPTAWTAYTVALVVALMAILRGGPRNVNCARRYQREIETLDGAELDKVEKDGA